MTKNPSRNKLYILIALIIAPLLILFLGYDALPQDQTYHHFADRDYLFGIPNFHNVTSNILFITFALYGLREYAKHPELRQKPWLIFLLGVLLVGPGSAYYHLSPNDDTLVWDRLPMTIGFMGLTTFAVVDALKLNGKVEYILQSSLLSIGIVSVIYWWFYDDLRLYAWVQLTPILTIVYMAFFYRSKSLKTGYLLAAVAFYLVAKFTEHQDDIIFQAIGHGGHALKHHLAAFSVLSLILMRSRSIPARGQH